MEALKALGIQALTLSIPVDSEALNRQMQAAGPRLAGSLVIPNHRLSFLVPARGGIAIYFVVATGWVCTRRSPLRFESNYYHKDLLVDVWVDGSKVNIYPMPLTAPFEVDFGVHYVKRKSVDIALTNNTDNDALITVHALPHIIREDVYSGWYEPIVNIAYDLLTMLAKTKL